MFIKQAMSGKDKEAQVELVLKTNPELKRKDALDPALISVHFSWFELAYGSAASVKFGVERRKSTDLIDRQASERQATIHEDDDGSGVPSARPSRVSVRTRSGGLAVVNPEQEAWQTSQEGFQSEVSSIAMGSSFLRNKAQEGVMGVLTVELESLRNLVGKEGKARPQVEVRVGAEVRVCSSTLIPL